MAAGLAQQLLGDLTDRQVALIGAGEMGAVAVRALIQRGVSEVTVVNRTYERAQILADAWGGKAATFQHLPRILVNSDVIIVATGAPHIILTEEMVEQAMNERIPLNEVFAHTGIQPAFYNSSLHLLAESIKGNPCFSIADRLLFTPDLLAFWLSGVRANERTITSTSFCSISASNRLWLSSYQSWTW